MKRTIQVRAFRGERQYVAECLDLPVVTQAPTLDALAENIREAVGLQLDGEDLSDLGIANDSTIVVLNYKPWPDAEVAPGCPARTVARNLEQRAAHFRSLGRIQ